MRQVEKIKTLRWQVTEDDVISVFTANQGPAGHIALTATEGGRVFTGSIVSKGEFQDIEEVLRSISVEKLITTLDPFGRSYQHIDSDLIVKVMSEKAESLGLDRTDAIRNTAQFTTMAYLFNLANDVMTELFGPTWSVDLVPVLVGHSKEYKTVQRLAGTLKSLNE